ncbi:unnamed protein product [Paramecium primaurelia]|uniref:Uncharacterized protein n=1 Tax=Paramecium primaurelia TaxID=5886 RepID=A0A8S1NJD4_PARPR|nr:unnamed protein product [Paramecium primaurelia]
MLSSQYFRSQKYTIQKYNSHNIRQYKDFNKFKKIVQEELELQKIEFKCQKIILQQYSINIVRQEQVISTPVYRTTQKDSIKLSVMILMYKIEKGAQSIIQYILLKDAKSSTQQDKKSFKKAFVGNLTLYIEKEDTRKNIRVNLDFIVITDPQKNVGKGYVYFKEFQYLKYKSQGSKNQVSCQNNQNRSKVIEQFQKCYQEYVIKEINSNKRQKNMKQPQKQVISIKKQEKYINKQQEEKKIYKQKKSIAQINIMRTQSKI